MNLKKCTLLVLSIIMSSLNTYSQSGSTKVLILIHSDTGGTYELAKEIQKGIESDLSAQAIIKLVKASENDKLQTLPIATVEELPSYDGIVFGSPVYFGNISTGMSEFLAKTTGLWSKHALEGMPASVFMSAGSGAGNELAVQSFWNSLAVHGMVLVSNGIRGDDSINNKIPQGNTVLGVTSLTSVKNTSRPSDSERELAKIQGANFVKVASALKGTFIKKETHTGKEVESDVESRLKALNLTLPSLPQPVGNYQLFVRSGNLLFINQVSLKNGKVQNPGKLGNDLTEQQVKEATETTMLNVLAIVKQAVGGDFNRVKQCVQLTGIFNTEENYTQHAALMNAASDLTVKILGEKGKHARATYGASSLPVNSSVEIQAIFEIE